MNYKLRIYFRHGTNYGNLDHEEFFNTKEKMETRYRIICEENKKFFGHDIYAMRPTAWENSEIGWKRMMGY